MYFMCNECSKVEKWNQKLSDMKLLQEQEVTLDSFHTIFELYECSEEGCDGKMFMVDELILPTLIELNKKGYKTLFSCSGHLIEDEDEKGFIGTYIVIDSIPDDLPDSFYAVKVNSGKYGLYSGIDYVDGQNTLQIYDKIVQLNRELLEWSLKLEYRESVNNKL